MINYLSIGHVTEDVWQAGKTPGGTVTYSSRTARAFLDQVAVLTAAAADLDAGEAFPGINVHRLDAPNTTQFQNTYTPKGRIQIVSPCPVTLRPEHLTTEMRASAIVHLGPVCNEISPDVVDAVDPSTFVGVTPQGWMRRWDGNGHVTSLAANWVDASHVLARADAVVTSLDDIAGDWNIAHEWAAQTRLLLVTQGARGCTAFADGSTTQIPAPCVEEVEPTGAGDIFATVLFTALQRGDTLLHACTLANCIAAQSVTRPGLSGVPGAGDIEKCGQWRLK
jgi:sugar/nucleoside kinase (ribokinase family)